MKKFRLLVALFALLCATQGFTTEKTPSKEKTLNWQRVLGCPFEALGYVSFTIVDTIGNFCSSLIPEDPLRPTISLGRDLQYDPATEYVTLVYKSNMPGLRELGYNLSWPRETISGGGVQPSSATTSNPDIDYLDLNPKHVQAKIDSNGKRLVHIAELAATVKLKHGRCVQKQYGLNTAKTTFRCDGNMHTLYAKVCALKEEEKLVYLREQNKMKKTATATQAEPAVQ